MVDMTAAAAYREARGKLSFNALLMRAIVAGLQGEPSLNVIFTEAGYAPQVDRHVWPWKRPKAWLIAVIEDVAGCDYTALMDRIGSAVERPARQAASR